MQKLGTEFGRGFIGDSFWVNAWKKQVAECMAVGVVTDDCRFENEALAVRELGGIVVKLHRNGVVCGEHPSESSVKKILPDYIYDNSRSVEYMRDWLEKLATGRIE